MTDTVETELRLRGAQAPAPAAIAASLRRAGIQIAAGTRQRHLDTYFDDDCGSLGKAGIGLRRRDSSDSRVLTCKQRLHADTGLFVCSEHTVTAPADLLTGSSSQLPEPIRDRVEPFVLARPLLPRLQLVIDRECWELATASGERATLALDRVQLLAGAAAAQFFELELEIAEALPTWRAVAEQLSSELSLPAASDDKASHAAALLGSGPSPVAAATELGNLLAKQLLAVQRAEVGFRLQPAAKTLHQLRLALRQLRSLVSAFRHRWPDQAAALRSTLGATSNQLGGLRDLDVLLAEWTAAAQALPQPLQSSNDELLQHWHHRRAGQLAELLAFLRSEPRLLAWQELAAQLTQPAADSAAGDTAEAAIATAIATAADRLRRRSKTLPDEATAAELHRLRLAGKLLRNLADAVDGLAILPAATRLLDKLLHQLGRLQDNNNAVQQLLAAACSDNGCDAAMAATLGALAGHFHRRADIARAKALRHLRRLRRRKLWRNFAAAEQASPHYS